MSSIALVAYQVIMIDDVSNGLLVYVAQAFLLVASIFGLDYYVKLITRRISLTSRVWRCNHELNELTYGKHTTQ